MEENPLGFWQDLIKRINSFNSSLNKSKAINVNAQNLIDQGKEIVQTYFRIVRPSLAKINFDPLLISFLDNNFQKLLSLTNGKNYKSSYKKIISDLNKSRTNIETNLELVFSQSFSVVNNDFSFSVVEKQIISTLAQLIPSAALSYEQAIKDLADENRISYRGSGTELRESLREVLDHLAPDDEVTKSEGFKLEKDRTKPTMRQKARFILKSRRLSKNALNAPQDTVDIIEEKVSSLARSVYERGSISTHINTTKTEVLQLKLYVDSILSELLEIHKGKG